MYLSIVLFISVTIILYGLQCEFITFFIAINVLHKYTTCAQERREGEFMVYMSRKLRRESITMLIKEIN